MNADIVELFWESGYRYVGCTKKVAMLQKTLQQKRLCILSWFSGTSVAAHPSVVVSKTWYHSWVLWFNSVPSSSLGIHCGIPCDTRGAWEYKSAWTPIVVLRATGVSSECGVCSCARVKVLTFIGFPSWFNLLMLSSRYPTTWVL